MKLDLQRLTYYFLRIIIGGTSLVMGMGKKPQAVKSKDPVSERLDFVLQYLRKYAIKAYPLTLYKTKVSETLTLGILPDQETGFISELEFSTGFFIDLKYINQTELKKTEREKPAVSIKEGVKSPIHSDLFKTPLSGDLKRKKIIQRHEAQHRIFQLRVTEGLDLGLRTLVHDKGIVIGRKAEDSIVDLALQDKSASKNHAKIIVDSFGKTIIKDLGSTNGTLVNDKPIETVVIREGDVITIGHTKIRLEKADSGKN
jgi:hypothetical protein